MNEEDTSDVFQESFRSLAGHLESFAPARSSGSFRSWLRTIVRTRVADHFRRQQKQPRAAGGTDAQLALASVADPVDEETEDEVADDHSLLVRRAMELIKPEFSERNWRAFEQIVLHGKSAVEVADELDVAPQAIRQANYRIRRRLRLVLAGLAEDIE